MLTWTDIVGCICERYTEKAENFGWVLIEELAVSGREVGGNVYDFVNFELSIM
jgi:hypothetical protein